MGSRPSSSESSALAQRITRLAEAPEVAAAERWFRTHEPEIARWQLEISAIPAPPFGEAPRSQWLAQKFREAGLQDVHVDDLGNVLGVRAASHGSCVSLSAHLDTVFPAGTGLNIRQEGPLLYGPGISDNAAGVVALLAIASVIRELEIPAALPLLFLGNVGEEGEGDLRGMRHIFTRSPWKDAISASIIIDGAGTDTIIAEALGSRRFEVTVRGPGGHSWSDFGAANPIVALSRAVHLFSQTRVSANPKTTFNVGVISGGTSVNSIPESASMRVDIRSTSSFEIERLEMELRKAIEQAVAEESRSALTRSPNRRNTDLDVEIKIIGSRPAGELPATSNLIATAKAVDSHLGNHAQVQRASTDANIPLSMGREAIALGAGGKGGGAHTLQEWFDCTNRELGLLRILLITLATAAAAVEANR